MGQGNRLGWLLLGGQAIAGWMAARNFAAIPSLQRSQPGELGHVSIVIPCRDEAERLPDLLQSLAHLCYPDYDVLVVDDASSDRTADIAEAEGVSVLRLAGPDPGWTGKSYACWAGAGATHGEWLLFTDADTVHGRDSLLHALAMATECRMDFVSLLARQRCETFWERVLLPYAYALYFAGARNINVPGGTALANGQYILIRRATYERIGGHKAVRASVIEDVALARLAAREGVMPLLVHGEDYLEVRMYHDLRSLWEGLSKNAVRFVTISPRTGFPTVLAGFTFTSALPLAFRSRSRLLRLGLLIAPAAALLPWERRFHVRAGFTLLHPLASCAFQLLALDSVRRVLTGHTIWKGRTY